MASILFYHSNLRLPERWDRRLGAIVMTPRVHGIHDDEAAAVRDCNWSSGLTLWDRLHSTLRRAPPQEAVVIGVEGLRRRPTLGRLLRMPFLPRQYQ